MLSFLVYNSRDRFLEYLDKKLKPMKMSLNQEHMLRLVISAKYGTKPIAFAISSITAKWRDIFPPL